MVQKFVSTKFVVTLLSLFLSGFLAYNGKLTYEFAVIILGLNGVYSYFRYSTEKIFNNKNGE